MASGASLGRWALEPTLLQDDDAAHLEARRALIKAQPGWWRELPRLELGFAVLDELRAQRFRLHVLTKGPFDTAGAWSEKVQWCRAHVPDAAVTITEDKGLVYGKVLVDDWPPYVQRWLEWRPRGFVVMPAQPWNVGFAHPNVLRFDGGELPSLRARLAAVRATASSDA